MSLISAQLKEILVCPVTRQPLEEDERGYLISKAANLAYPVRSGIPIMLPESAISLDELEKQTVAPSRDGE